MPKIAILHDDSGVADTAAACAARMKMDALRLDSPAALDEALAKGDVKAVVVDVVGRAGGGFELIEKLCTAAPEAAVLIVTGLDAKTAQSTERLARSKQFNVRVVRNDKFDEDTLKACLAEAPKDRTDITATNLQDSIEQNFLRVEYQPKVPFDPPSEPRYSVEALVRLRHPELGDVYPDQFISVAENSGLIQQLTDSVTRQVFADLAAWRAAGLHLVAAINVSPLLLNDNVWSTQFLERCEEFGVSPEDVTLEITESSMGAENSAALDVLTRLRLKGFTLSIDDFGTGFSSLANLYKLPFGELKLDKSFVMDLADSEEARALIETTASMARRIGLKVVAEGVETEQAFEQLRSFGCDYAQGYFISRPMTADRIPAFFEEWSRRAGSLTDRTQAVVAPSNSKIGVIQALLSEIIAAAPEADETLVIDPDASFPDPSLDPVHEVVRRIPSLVMKGKPLEALAACHEARLCLESKASSPTVADRLAQLERLLERELLAASPVDLDIEGGDPVRLIAGKPAVVGRGAAGGAVDIATNCRWFSRGERNLSVYARNGDWLVEDLGSTNGNLMNGVPLEAGQAELLPEGTSELRIGRDPDSCPPVALRLIRGKRDPDAVLARFTVDEAKIEKAAAEIRWSSWAEETRRRWIVLGSRITLGAAPDCALQADSATADSVAHIEYDEGGYWITPDGAGPAMIGGLAFHRRAPMPVNVQIEVGGVRFTACPPPPGASAASGKPRVPLVSSA